MIETVQCGKPTEIDEESLSFSPLSADDHRAEMLPELFEEHEGEDGVRDETDRRWNETLETQTTALKTEPRI